MASITAQHNSTAQQHRTTAQQRHKQQKKQHCTTAQHCTTVQHHTTTQHIGWQLALNQVRIRSSKATLTANDNGDDHCIDCSHGSIAKNGRGVMGSRGCVCHHPLIAIQYSHTLAQPHCIMITPHDAVLCIHCDCEKIMRVSTSPPIAPILTMKES